MTREWDVPDSEAAKTVCRCRLRYGAADHQPGDQDHVDWAGLPVNLDLAFSPAQRDKVYAQHLMRKRQAQLRRWSNDRACVCEIVAEDASLEADLADSTSGR
ncbi:hypothetical protein OQ968_19705 [Mycobacterium sp. 663a-19]|uniref:hypothetical protein n=1 Tax=Mycobacterium sp. 663a-19 TaxID=2986148 RepID=UPI002D1E9A2C|nr:hypothetical protein [Mycobacterium sp. 663a-19]MEB3983481.1 hypothetical protein [Mycobacterium sp. 663a-19]